MQISLKFNTTSYTSKDLVVIGTFCKTQKSGKKNQITPILTDWDKQLKKAYEGLNSKDQFNGSKKTSFLFDAGNTRVLVCGLGESKSYSAEDLRRAIANVLKQSQKQVKTLSIDLDSFLVEKDLEKTIALISESLIMTSYSFDKYKSQTQDIKLKQAFLESKTKKIAPQKTKKALEEAIVIAESVNICRSFVNEPPNVLNSITYAKEIEKDIKGVKGVRIKTLGLQELKKEKMRMFLSVNAGSAHHPRLVHLTYTPSKATKNTKHIALVGKGITFDTGGYSLKPSSSIINMKFDMAGSSTVYAAFRAAAKLQLPLKISCFLGLTDNAVSRDATMPDSIVTARNGKTVEILNTDAEGRLVLGDCLDYACSQKPDAVIDCATLTGACLVALGTEMCGLMGNDHQLTQKLQKSAKAVDEYMWELPIIPEWSEDMKSPIADLKNIGGSRFAGTAKAAAFLQEFIQEGIAWAHLDIAGIGDSQGHLPYCPPKGGSGMIVRSLVEFLRSES